MSESGACANGNDPLRHDSKSCVSERSLLEAGLRSREQDIRKEILQIPSPADRVNYVNEVCSDDPQLRRRMLSWLENVSKEAAESGKEFSLLPDTEPRPLNDRYRLLQKIGEGGFGTVYLAEQITPVRRRVAIKTLKLGMDTRQVIARFELERQALAMMDHPNIAKVFDAGATETGRPYFVMELVRGAPITEFCQRQQITIRRRLELFVDVCQAIQHAHQKGIIHRDLKPSNILVTFHDGTLVPKVIDFGIAKATEQDSAQHTLLTQEHQLLGTPAYISPEQAALTNTDIDTRSDIYSLGVLLYELLTGSTPFDSKALLQSGVDEMRRTIREKDPVRPSTRLSHLRAHSPRSGSGQPESQISNTSIPRDLDWIVMKCLEKDRARRYATANGLAMDVQRHLQHQPVLAGPQTITYRFLKLVRRNPTITVLCTLLVLALVVALTIGVMMSLEIAKAKQAGDRANLRLSETVRYLEWQKMEELANQGRHQRPLAWFAKLLRENPNDRVGASRVVSGRTRHNFALPSAVPLVHGGPVNSADFSPDGTRVVTASEDGSVRVWDAQNGHLLTSFTNAGPAVSVAYFAHGTRLGYATRGGVLQVRDTEKGTLIFEAANLQSPELAIESDDGRWVYCFSQNRSIVRWNLLSGQGPELLVPISSNVSRVSKAGERLAIGCEDGTLLVLEAFTGSLKAKGQDLGRNWEGLQLTPDGRRLFVSFKDQPTVVIWEYESSATDGGVKRFEPPPAIRLQEFLFVPDGSKFLTFGWRGELRLWDAEKLSLLPFEAAPEGMPIKATLSREGFRVASFSQSGVARVYDLRPGEPSLEAFEHEGPIRSMKFSPDGGHVVTASQDGTARLWNVRMRTAPPVLLPMCTGGGEASFNPDATRVVASIRPDAVQVCDATSGLPLSPPLEHPPSANVPTHVGRASFSPDGSRIVTVGQEGLLRVWDATNFSPLFDIPIGRPLNMARFSPDAQYIVAVDRRGYVTIWSGANGQAIGEPLQHSEEIVAFNFRPDGKAFLTASVDGTARCWSLPERKPLLVLRHRGIVWAASYSPDGECIVTASADRTAQVWNARTGEPVGKPLRHEKDVFSASFSPNGQWVLTTSEDGTARVWNVATGEPVSQIMRHAEKIWLGRFSPDGRSVATGSNDRTVRLWDARTGLPLSAPLQHPGHLGRLAFSPDGKRLLSFGGEPARIWNLIFVPAPIPDWFPELLEAVAGYRLTADDQFSPVSPERLISLRERLVAQNSQDFYSTWAKWFLAGRMQNPVPPLTTK